MSDDPHGARDAELLATLLPARDVPCPACGYNLRGVASPACPECGAQLDVRVGTADPKLGPWLVALLGVALPLGYVTLTVLFAGAWLVQWGSRARPFNTSIQSTVTYLLFLIGLPLLLAMIYGVVLTQLIRRCRRFWARPRRDQERRAILCVLLGVGLTALLLWSRWLLPLALMR